MIRGGVVVILTFLLTLPLTASDAQENREQVLQRVARALDSNRRAGEVRLAELSLCESSADQINMPSFSVSKVLEACNSCNVSTVRVKFTANVVGPEGPTPVLVLTTPFGSPNALELKNAEPQEMSISCDLIPGANQQIGVFAQPAFARHVKTSQEAPAHDVMPRKVGSLTTEWTSCETPTTELKSRSTDYVVRTCPNHRRFPGAAAGGVALVSRAGTDGSPPRHEVIIDDRNSPLDLESANGLNQVVLLSPSTSMATMRAPSAPIPHSFAGPVDLDVAVWVLDGETTLQQVQSELEETNAIFARSLMGIRLRLALFNDTRDASAKGQLLQKKLAEFCPSPPGNGSRCDKDHWPAIHCSETTVCDGTPSCNAPVYREVAYDKNKINLYYARSVFGLGVEGMACRKPGDPYLCAAPSEPNNAVVLSRISPAFPGRLAHELGHVFGLGHPEAQGCGARGSEDLQNKAFPNNLMVVDGQPVGGPLQNVGDFLTPAQVLMAYTSPGSWLRKALDKRQRTEPLFRACPMPVHQAASDSCIPLYTDRARSTQVEMQALSPSTIERYAGGMQSLAPIQPSKERGMDPNMLLTQLLLGGILGMTGQGTRVIVGMKKLNEKATALDKPIAQLFSASTLLTSLLIGFVAGVLAILGVAGVDTKTIDQDTMFAILAAGYAGTDFIEGFISRRPPSKWEEGKSEAVVKPGTAVPSADGNKKVDSTSNRTT